MDQRFKRFLRPVFNYIEDKEKAELTAKLRIATQAVAANKPEQEEASGSFRERVPYEFNGKDYVTFLLHIDAEIEHGLMLQYLYAAYSLGGPEVPERYHDVVRQWQEVILGVAKEEMGHFISVQNVLRGIGGPLNFGRQDYPWDTPFYPFPFKLEPLTLDSLAKYLYAESPPKWIDSPDPVARDAKRRLNAQVEHPVRVGALFEVLLDLIQDPLVIPNSAFQASTFPFQAKFDEWGRNYTGGQRGNASGGNPKGAPDVLVVPIASRDDAYAALSEIAEQGEALKSEDVGSLPSHFVRFHAIYAKWMEIDKETNGAWSPSRNLAVNPYIPEDDSDPGASPADGQVSDEERESITDPESQLWAHLFNTRYRMLLNFLTHSFMLDDGFNQAGLKTPRGAIINSTFGEMYNLRSIATALVQMPLKKGGGNDATQKLAGPPFQMPYTLILPMGEANRWAVHKDCLEASGRIIASLLPKANDRNRQYLLSLREADKLMLSLIHNMSSTPA